MSSLHRLCVFLVAFAGTVPALADSDPKPWRLHEAMESPSWLSFSVEQRSRYEHVENDFRANADWDAEGLAIRTILLGEARAGSFAGTVELVDARFYATELTPRNNGLENTLDVLQAWVGFDHADAFASGDRAELKAGRMTIDLGSRRIVARNGYRNTINAYTGVDTKYTSPGKHVARAFAVMPVSRLPSDSEGLAEHAVEMDKENRDSLLWSTGYTSPDFLGGSKLELYVVGFHERDGDDLATRNRQLVTFGARWSRKPKLGRLDWDLEVMPQTGSSRESTKPEDTMDLDHTAISTSAQVGLSPDMPWKPRFAALFDHATGDAQPTDGTHERFDPLFGARRFDFNPTGLYGPFARANLVSPGLRASAQPAKQLELGATYRLCWLASATDAWTPANVRDPSGMSGRFIGEQLEGMIRYTPRPKNLAFEVGAAYLRRGDFAKFAPGTRDDGSTYVYTQATLTL